MITYHLHEIEKSLEFNTSNYDKIFLMGDFNSDMSETSINSYTNVYLRKRLAIKFPSVHLALTYFSQIVKIISSRQRF